MQSKNDNVTDSGKPVPVKISNYCFPLSYSPPKQKFLHSSPIKYKHEKTPQEKYDAKIYCSNCGVRGHLAKECNAPITSYGLIVFKVVHNKEQEINDLKCGDPLLQKYLDTHVKQDDSYPKLKFLMIQRKDTMSYIDFLRGKYTCEYDLSTEFSEMTITERHDLETKTFEQLWDALWKNKGKLYRNEFTQAKEKFNKIDIKGYLAKTQSKWQFPELSVPKGRRGIKENNITCAEREFNEETCYEKQMYEFLRGFPEIVEEFTGTNNIRYKHVYYLTKLKDQYVSFIPSIQKSIDQGEVKSIGWYTMDETLALIRDYDTEKKKILQTMYQKILKMNFKYILCENYYQKTKVYIQDPQETQEENILDLPTYLS